MTLANIYSSWMWVSSGGQYDVSTTVARQGGPGWAFAETCLAREAGSGTAIAWISAYRYGVGDQQFNALYPNPDGAPSALWINNCYSATFTLRVNNNYAYGIAKLIPWM